MASSFRLISYVWLDFISQIKPTYKKGSLLYCNGLTSKISLCKRVYVEDATEESRTAAADKCCSNSSSSKTAVVEILLAVIIVVVVVVEEVVV